MDWQNAIFGPGWVWSALGMVLVVASLLGVYRQLRSSGAANALQRIETLQGQWDSPRMIHAKLTTALQVRSGSHDETTFFKAQPILDFFSNLDDLEAAGHLRINEIWQIWGTPIEVFAGLLEPTLEAMRRRFPGIGPDLSPLLRKLRAYEQERGKAPMNLDEESLSTWLELAIAMNTARYREESEWRTGAMPTMS